MHIIIDYTIHKQPKLGWKCLISNKHAKINNIIKVQNRTYVRSNMPHQNPGKNQCFIGAGFVNFTPNPGRKAGIIPASMSCHFLNLDQSHIYAHNIQIVLISLRIWVQFSVLSVLSIILFSRSLSYESSSLLWSVQVGVCYGFSELVGQL